MITALPTARLVPMIAGAVMAAMSVAGAQDKPVTPPDSYRVVMENDRVRMIEIHVKPRSKVNVDSPAGRDRFLYMLSDGALILAPPGKTPYEFALHAGETAVFPAVSPTVENDTDSAVRALMVEVKEGGRTAATAKPRGKFAKRGAQGRVAAKSKGTKSSVARTKSRTKQAAKSRKPQAAASTSAPKPLNLRNANARPAKKVTGKSKGNSS
jgi:quercetin dioxygenase-like cupin family protein